MSQLPESAPPLLSFPHFYFNFTLLRMDCEEERLIHWEDVLDYSGDKKRLLQQTAKYRSNKKAPNPPPPPHFTYK